MSNNVTKHLALIKRCEFLLQKAKWDKAKFAASAREDIPWLVANLESAIEMMKKGACVECEGQGTTIPWAPRGENRGTCEVCDGDGTLYAAWLKQLPKAKRLNQ